MEAIKKEITILVKKLNQWSYNYYVLNQSLVSDEVYDANLHQLIKLEKKYPHLILKNSPSKRVGDVILDEFKKVTHKTKMLSLANAFTYEDLIKFDNDNKKVLNKPKITYYVEPKIDGLAISIVYKNQQLLYGATRGDGEVGEDVTHNIKTIHSIPLKIANDDDFIEFRGEVFLPKKEFEILNKKQEKEDKPLFANPRNVASGTMRNLDSSIAKKRNLDAILYWSTIPQNENITTLDQINQYIKKNYGKVNALNKVCMGIGSVIEYIKFLIEKRNDLPYETDGVVIKINNLDDQKKLKSTIKHPKWAIAFKMPTEKVETIVKKIFPTLGRTGKITYNAEVEPVKVAGSTVRYATLHNANFIVEKDLRINDYVLINKAGDIIPEILEVIVKKRKSGAKKWEESQECPFCSSKLQRIGGEVDQFCLNEFCEEKKLQNIIHFTSRQAMNIVGLGEKVIRRFYKEGIVKNIQDIFLVANHQEKIVNLENFGEKSFANLIKEIKNSKKRSLENVLFALGIKHIGKKTSLLLAKTFNNIDALLKTIKDKEAIKKIHEIGDKIVNSLYKWFSDEKNMDLINFLKEKNINFIYLNGAKNNILEGQKIVLTGTLSFPRTYFIDKINSSGGEIVNSISKNTTFLLKGENPGSKLQKAIDLGIKVVSEKEFLKIIGE